THEMSGSSFSYRRQNVDLYEEILSWLTAPNLPPKELEHRREMLQLRLLLLNKLDEDYYIRRYIKLRTR
ncbi:hypothetical protein KR215_003338, partial [Drosophila sulfurigaster]